MNLDDLADLLKSRECGAVWYFHTDHFEPWSFSIDEESARAVERMRELARRSRYARKLSLFYSVFIPYRLAGANGGESGAQCATGDGIEFGTRSEREERLAREAIRPLVTADSHELHLHVHHEFWTRNSSDFDNPVSRWVNACSTPDLDKARLDLHFRLCNEAIEREIGRPLERWGFIHGNWALNASDPLICQVADEMATIMRHGGFGDFSFPAGRGYCNPKLEAPFTCAPLELPRAYDDPRTDPRPVGVGTGVLRSDRFFIWSSPLKSSFSSLDYYSQSNRELFRTPERVVEEWLAKSVVLDHRLFLKTHAHSMRREYKIGEADALIPHCYPDVRKILDCLSQVCDRARVELRLVTVNEVMSVLRDLESRVGPAPEVARRKVSRAALAFGRIARPGRLLSSLEAQLGTALHDRGRAALEYLVAKFPVSQTKIIAAGASFSVPSLFLAAAGFKVTAFEEDRSRYYGLLQLADGLRGRAARLRGNLELVCGPFPDAFWRRTLAADRRNVLLASGAEDSVGEARRERLLRAGAVFDDVLIEMAQLGAPRHRPQALRPEIAESYRVLGWVWRGERDEIWHLQPLEVFRAAPAPRYGRPIGAAGLSPAAAEAVVSRVDAKALNAELIAMHAEWKRRASARFAADNLYQSKLARGTALEPHEVAIGAAIARRFSPESTSIVEIGSGYGAFAVLLARYGFAVRSFEGNHARYAAAAWHCKETLERHPSLEGRLTLAKGFFPQVFAGEVVAGGQTNLCLATNVTCSYTATHQEALFRAAVAFDELILDLARFGKARNEQRERDSLFDALANSYFEPVERLYVYDPYEYWRFRTRPILPRRTPQSVSPTQIVASPVSRGPSARLAEPKPDGETFPLHGEEGLLYSVFGDKKLSQCPVCGGADTVPIWRMPMADLETPISLFGGYFNQVPALKTPGVVYCFDFCRGCESIFLNPVAAGQKEGYRVTDHYLRMMESRAEWQGYEDVYDGFAKWIPADASVMIDAACGIGQYLHVARRRGTHPWRRLIGLELALSYVEHMRGEGLEAHTFDIDNDDLLQLVAPNSVDFITFCEAFEHVERPLDALRKLLAALRPGGRLFFTAQRYGGDVRAAVRPGEPIYISERVVREMPQRLGCRILDRRTSGMRYLIVLEK